MSESLLAPGGNSVDPAPADPAPADPAPADPAPADPAPADPAPADPAPPVDPKVVLPEDWKLGLDDDIRNDPSLGAIKDIQNLAKSYVNAQRMIGGDKIQVPNKYDDGTQLRTALNKLGLPQDAKDYEVKSAKEAYDEDLLKEYGTKAYEFGVLPKQAQALYDWFETRQENSDTTYKEQYETKVEGEIKDLQKEWGAGFKPRVDLANQTLDHFTEGDDTLREHIIENYGKDTTFIKFLATVGDSLKEGRIIKEGNDDPFAVTPDVAQRKLDEMRGDKTHPVNDKDHPAHEHALKEFAKLSEVAYS